MTKEELIEALAYILYNLTSKDRADVMFEIFKDDKTFNMIVWAHKNAGDMAKEKLKDLFSKE